MTHQTNEELDALVKRLTWHREHPVTGKLVYANEDGPVAAAVITALRAALAASQPADPATNDSCFQPVRVKHVERGSSYRVIGAGKVQTGTPLHDYDEVVIYQGEAEGRLWVRPTAEFGDGRFEHIEPADHSADAGKMVAPVTPAEAAKVQALVDEVFLAFENVNSQIDDDGEFTERAWEQLRAALAAWKGE